MVHTATMARSHAKPARDERQSVNTHFQATAAYWKQDNPLFLATTSFLTQTHNLQRARWMVKDATPGQRVRTVTVLNELATMTPSRAELKARLAQLQGDSDKIISHAAKDLDLTLTDIPDSALSIDWPHLCREMADDLNADKTLAALQNLDNNVLYAWINRTPDMGATCGMAGCEGTCNAQGFCFPDQAKQGQPCTDPLGACTGCLLCSTICPDVAITVYREAARRKVPVAG